MDRETARSLARDTKVRHSSLGLGTWSHTSSIDGPTAAWIYLAGQANLTLVDFTKVELDEPRIQFQRWEPEGEGDQIDLEMLAADIRHVSRGTVFLYPADTGSYDMGYVLSDRELTPEEVRQASQYTPKGASGAPA